MQDKLHHKYVLQANREDPFKLVDANYNFYQQLEDECCQDQSCRLEILEWKG